jgi:hypothetical protein
VQNLKGFARLRTIDQVLEELGTEQASPRTWPGESGGGAGLTTRLCSGWGGRKDRPACHRRAGRMGRPEVSGLWSSEICMLMMRQYYCAERGCGMHEENHQGDSYRCDRIEKVMLPNIKRLQRRFRALGTWRLSVMGASGFLT